MSSYRIVKHKQREIFNVDTKLVIMNVFNKFREKYPTISVNDVVEWTSEFTGVSRRTVHKIREEDLTKDAVTKQLSFQATESPPDDAVMVLSDLETSSFPDKSGNMCVTFVLKKMEDNDANNGNSRDDCSSEKVEQMENKSCDSSSEKIVIKNAVSESSSNGCSNEKAEQILATCLTKQEQEGGPTQACGSKFICKVCRKTFLDSDTFEIHKNEHSKEGSYPCTLCNISFRWKEFLDTHLLIHVGGRPYICQICGEEFLWKRDLKSHFENHALCSDDNEKLLFPCLGCGKTFGSKSSRMRHKTCGVAAEVKQEEEEEEGEEATDSSCPILSQLLRTPLPDVQLSSPAQKQSLVSSETGMLCLSNGPSVYDDKDLTCRKCGKFFDDVEQFREHTKLHNLDGPFACTDCSSSYLWKEFLSTHQRMHVYRRPYNCDVCGDHFDWKGELRLHFEDHVKYLSENMGPYPFICVDCRQRFISSDLLRRHRKDCQKSNPTVCSYQPPLPKIRKQVPTKRRDTRPTHYRQLIAVDGMEEDSVEIKMEKDPLEAADCVNLTSGIDVKYHETRDSGSHERSVSKVPEVKEECIEIEEEEDPL